jgi:hypothetical protein
MALPSNEVQIRNYIASITAGKFLQDYTKLNEENRAMSVVIARNKGYIGSTSDDLSKIPPFMFYQVVDEAINATKGISEIYESYKKITGADANAAFFNTEIRKAANETKYGYNFGAISGTANALEKVKSVLVTPNTITQYIAFLNEIYEVVKTNPKFTQ